MKQVRLLLLILTIGITVNNFAQKQHKIVFQFTNANDTNQQKAFTRQLYNVLEYWPKAKIEVVCYNNGIDYLLTAKTKHAKAITDLKSKGVEFVACNNTMTLRNINPSELIPEAGIVPAGIPEVVEKQEKGWIYIKGGF